NRQTSVITHAYLTTDTSTAPSFSYTPLNVGGGMRGASSAAAAGTTLYVGIVNGGGSGVPAILPIPQPFTNAGNAVFPSQLINTNGTALVDSMLGLNGVLYAANAGGCARYDGATLTACTPSTSAWGGLTPVTTSKVSDFVPADKAVPQMAASGGSLFLARNPQA